MFSKLCKHEFKGISKFAVPLLIALGIAGILICFAIAGNVGSLTQNGDTYLSEGMEIALVLILLLAVLAIGVVSAVMEILLFVRYYKTTMTEEGYLTFTLPVKTHEIFLSKFLMAFVWELIIILANAVIFGAGVVTFLAALPPELLEEFLFQLSVEFDFEMLFEMFKSFLRDPQFVAILVSVGIQAVFLLPYSIITIFTMITVASTIAKRNRLLVMIGLFFGWAILVNVFQSFLVMGSDVIADFDMYFVSDVVCSWITTICQIGVCVGFTFLDKFLLEKHLNI
ncbi:MAG: hypothetical protein J5993_01655 [Clostridia bacterium]|nr:hypothetical protein [Clostridia bacterium]